MADEKQPVIEATPTPATPSSEALPISTVETPAVKESVTPVTTPEAQPRTVTYEALKEERDRRKALQRDMREMQRKLSEKNVPNFDPNDPNSQAKYVRHLETQVAESQLERKTRDLLKDYPELPKDVRKAILRNPLGFCKPGTDSVDNGILDIQEYIEELSESLAEGAAVPQLKTVQVAGGNTPSTSQPGATPKEINDILHKDITSWTPEETKLVSDYRSSHT